MGVVSDRLTVNLMAVIGVAASPLGILLPTTLTVSNLVLSEIPESTHIFLVVVVVRVWRVTLGSLSNRLVTLSRCVASRISSLERVQGRTLRVRRP